MFEEKKIKKSLETCNEFLFFISLNQQNCSFIFKFLTPFPPFDQLFVSAACKRNPPSPFLHLVISKSDSLLTPLRPV